MRLSRRFINLLGGCSEFEMRARLVDVSRYQGVINGKALKDAGFCGIISRCTIGNIYYDPYYENNRKEARNNELIFGAYHVLWPINRDPRGEARWFTSHCGDIDFSVLDDELGVRQHSEGHHTVSGEEILSMSHLWLRETDAIMLMRPWLYTGSWFWNDPKLPTPAGWEKDYFLWEAEYLNVPSGQDHWHPDQSPEITGPQVLGDGWDDWKMWQWTSKGLPVGVQSKVLDYNVFNGTVDELKNLLGVALPNEFVIESEVPKEAEIIRVTLRRS